MLPETLQVLIDYNYWANARLLDAAARVTVEQFVAPTSITTRNLRDTLLHTLDVEWSWRLRLEGRPAVEWGPDAELQPSDFPTVAVLTERWHEDERAMRAYIASLRADDLRTEIDLGPRDRFPLWYFLVHLLQHSTIQRADAATLLTQYGHSPGDLEFLDFVDWQ